MNFYLLCLAIFFFVSVSVSLDLDVRETVSQPLGFLFPPPEQETAEHVGHASIITVRDLVAASNGHKENTKGYKKKVHHGKWDGGFKKEGWKKDGHHKHGSEKDWGKGGHEQGKWGKHRRSKKKHKGHHEKKHGKKNYGEWKKDGGKKGTDWFKDKGHKKHGWKNVYHKEEWGDNKKYHDIWHDKDWKKKWNKLKHEKEKEAGENGKDMKERKNSTKMNTASTTTNTTKADRNKNMGLSSRKVIIMTRNTGTRRKVEVTTKRVRRKIITFTMTTDIVHREHVHVIEDQFNQDYKKCQCIHTTLIISIRMF